MKDYCGSTGTEWVPDIFPQSCQLHDICYEQQIYTQYDCDKQFLNNMIDERGAIFIPIAIIYCIAVIAFGKSSYRKLKKE